MTVDQWIRSSGNAFRKARALQSHLTDLAQVARSVGFEREANSLMQIASRAMPCAEAYVESLGRRVQ